MEINQPIIVFDDSSKKRVLNSLGFKVNRKSEIIDETEQILTDQDFEPIEEKNFGGILTGSKIVIKKDTSELVKYFVRKNK